MFYENWLKFAKIRARWDLFLRNVCIWAENCQFT